MDKSAMIIINPTAGKEQATKYEEKVKDTIKGKYPNIVVKHTKGPDDARKFAKIASEDSFDLLLSLGGDGTVNEIINGLGPYKKPPLLGIIPLGTVNDLARSLNIPMNPNKAIELLLQGKEKKIDIGLANNKYFTNILGIGNPARAIHDVEIKDKSNLGPLAYLIAIAKEISNDDIFLVELEMDKEGWEGDVSVVLVALIDSLGSFKFIFSDVELGDGFFHIFAIKKLNISKLMNMTKSLILEDITASKNVKYFKSKSLTIKTPGEKNYESDIDGQKGPLSPLQLNILPGHLRVISNLEH